MDDPYATLGVKRDASQDDIRLAYRKLAKKHHPDLNPGNPKAEEQFKTVSAANELLSNAEKRARYDAGEIDAAGQERPPQPSTGIMPKVNQAAVIARLVPVRRPVDGMPRILVTCSAPCSGAIVPRPATTRFAARMNGIASPQTSWMP